MLKIEFEELILADAPIEISGFTLDEIDQIVLGRSVGPSSRGRSRLKRAPRLSPCVGRRLSARAASPRLRRRDRSRGRFAGLMEGDRPARLS